MSGDVTYQALERLSHMPDNPSNPADAIAGQKYYDVEFTGGNASNLTIRDSTIVDSTFSGVTFDNLFLNPNGNIISTSLATDYPSYVWPLVWLSCDDTDPHAGGEGNPFCSITLENISTTNKFGELAFQTRIAGVPTDTFAWAVDPARDNTENFKLRHTGQDLLEFAADNSAMTAYTNILLDGSIGKILQSYNASRSAAVNVARLATINATPDYLILGMSSANLAGVSIQSGSGGESIRIPGATAEAWFINRVGIGTGSQGGTAKLTVYGANGEGTNGQTIRLGINSSVDYSIRRNNGDGNLEFQGTQAGAMGYKFMSTSGQIAYIAENGATTLNNLAGTGTRIVTASPAGLLGTAAILSPANGGTGIDNATRTITLGGNLTTIGAFNATLTVTNTTNVTLPESGTLATTAYVDSAVSAANIIINGAFSINQRAPASNADDTYAHDRWYVLTQTGAIAVSTVSNAEDGTPFMARLTQSQASAQRMGYAQIVEGINCKHLRGQEVTFNFGRFRCSASQAIRFAVLEWTGTEDVVTSDVVADWTSGSYTAGGFFLASNLTVSGVTAATPSAATLTDGPELTVTLGSSFNNLIVFAWVEGTAAQNVTLDLSKAFLGLGDSAPDYQYGDIASDLVECQRYYYRANATAAANTVFGIAYVETTTVVRGFTNFPVTMRTSPGALEQSGTATDYSVLHGGTDTTCSAVPTFTTAAPSGAGYRFTVASGLTVGQAVQQKATSANAYLGWSAEL